MLTIEQVAALAWNLTKPATDPLFHLCARDFQQKLVYHAQNVQNGGPASDDFELEVKDILVNPRSAEREFAEMMAPPKEEPVIEVPADSASESKPLPKATAAKAVAPAKEPVKTTKKDK